MEIVFATVAIKQKNNSANNRENGINTTFDLPLLE